MKEIIILLAAIALHGLGHLTAARLCGMRATGIRPTPTGLRLFLSEHDFPTYESELLIALGGPLGNLLGNVPLILVQARLPSDALREVVALSLFLGCWNLLPIEGFDGGRALRCLLLRHHGKRTLTPDAVDRLLRITSGACFLGLWLLSVYLVLRTGRALSLFLFCLQLFWGLCREQLRSHARYGE